MTKPLISVVTPCLNEEENVEYCYDAVRRVFAGLPQYDYEHIFCDNASSDRTPELLEGLAARDRRVKVIFNSRNFGPIHSVHNALLSATGDAVFVCLPVDLQDPPEAIPEFLEKWQRRLSGCLWRAQEARRTTLLANVAKSALSTDHEDIGSRRAR